MGEDFVKETQNKLGKIIDKPPLTEKLLKKPPFRYLHDIVTEVIKKSSFMKGLYNDSEMDSKNFKDKESKIAFLQKAVEVVVMVTGKSLSVRPSKIVAGHEPDKTNELLQAIANAVLKKMDSTEAVRKVLNGEKPGSGKPPKPHKDEEKGKDRHSEDKHKRDKENREKKSSSIRERSSSGDKDKDRLKDRSKDRSKDRRQDRSKDREKDRDKERNRDKDKNGERSKDRDREKDKSRDKERSKDKERERTSDKDKHRDRDRHKEKDRSKDRNKEKENGHEPENKNKEKEKEKDRERRERRRRKDDEEARRKEQEEQQQANENHEGDEEDIIRPPTQEDDGSSSNRIQRPSSAKGQRRRPTKDNDELDGAHADGMVNGDDGLPPQGASRRMARPSSARPAPPRVKKQEALDDPGSRVNSGKQVSNVIVDDGQNSDDDDAFVVQETQPVVDEEPQPMGGEELADDGEHGGLVKKILETKKELEGGNKIQNKEEKPVIMDAARRKERQLIQREVEKLRGSIQTLTRSANPLGKIMDYLQEDVDSMQKELEMWKKENQEHALAIKREEGITSTELEPLQAQLSELDQSIADQLDAIAAVKSNIIRNDEKTNKMLSSVAFSR